MRWSRPKRKRARNIHKPLQSSHLSVDFQALEHQSTNLLLIHPQDLKNSTSNPLKMRKN
jgi:hypothetical protein